MTGLIMLIIIIIRFNMIQLNNIPHLMSAIMWTNQSKGTTINDLGSGDPGKKFGGPSLGKKIRRASSKKKN